MSSNNSIKRSLVSIALAFTLAILVLAIQNLKNERDAESRNSIHSNSVAVEKEHLTD
jgi:preprotein translocase subunit SecG